MSLWEQFQTNGKVPVLRTHEEKACVPKLDDDILTQIFLQGVVSI